jgi:CubicO group peptidase (beta-lactamase class C family)
METAVAPDARVTQALELALELGEVGIAVAAYLGEALIVDASAGFADPDRALPVEPSTLFPVFSVTKALTATALHLQSSGV